MNLLTYVFIFLFSFSSFAQNEFDDLISEIIPKTRLSNAELKELHQELKVQKMLLEGIKELDVLGIEITEGTNNTIKELLIKSFRSKSQTLPKEVQEQVMKAVETSIKEKNIGTTAKKIKEFVNKTIHAKTASLTSTARRFGVDVGIFYAAAMQFDYTIPLILMSQGEVQLGATLLALPISSTSTAAYVLAKKAIKFNQVVKFLGGPKGALQHQSIFKKVKNFFHTNVLGKFDLIDLNINDKTFVMTVERSNLLNKTFTKLGWNKKLNFENLLNFLKEENLFDEFVGVIERSKNPSEVKVLRILRQFERSENYEAIEKLKNKFSNYINEVTPLPNLSEMRTWAIKASTAKTFEELYTHLASMPEEIPPRTLNRIWKNFILPEASKNIGPYISKETYQTFRNLYKNFDEIEKSLMTSMEGRVGREMKEKFTTYFYNAVPGLSACELNFHKKVQYTRAY